MANDQSIREWNQRKDGEEVNAGKVLFTSLLKGRETRDQQTHFRAYLNAFAIASEIVWALSQRPGFVEMDGRAAVQSMREMTKAVKQVRNFLQKQVEKAGLPADGPQQIAQLNRIAAEAVAKNWSTDPEENRRFYKKPKDGSHLTSFDRQMMLFANYAHDVARHLQAQDVVEPDSARFVENRNLDRLLAAHAVFQRIDEVVHSFVDRYLVDRPESFHQLILGESATQDRDPDTLGYRLVTDVIFPEVDERHDAIMRMFDPDESFGNTDRHIAYRALMRTISRDVALIIDCEERLFVDQAKRIAKDPSARKAYQGESGVLVPWLRDRLKVRLDRIYPRPDEYHDPHPQAIDDSPHRRETSPGPVAREAKKKGHDPGQG